MNDYDLVQIYKRMERIDKELKELKKEIGTIKWYQQHGTHGAVASSSTVANKQWVPQWEENLEPPKEPKHE